MTYLEKYKKEHPGQSEEEYQTVVRRDCPIDKDGYVLRCPPLSSGVKPGISTACPVCWNQEIPGTEPTNNTTNEKEDRNMNKIFTKDDIKVGYVVKYRNGNIAMAMHTYLCAGEKVITALRSPIIGWSDLNDYTTDLRGPNHNDDYDIMEVYVYSKYAHKCTDVSTNFRDLLWKREEKPCDKCAHEAVCVFKKGIFVNKDHCLHFMKK